ncbi:hypothetical protein YC2023_010198 [Brassica napus]
MLRNTGVRESNSQVRIGLRRTVGSVAFSPKCVSKHKESARNYKAVSSLGYLYLMGNSYGTAGSYVKTVREQLWNGKKVISERMESGQEEGESRERGKLVGKRERWPEGRSESQIWPRFYWMRWLMLSDRSDELKEGSDTVLGTILAMERCGTEVIDLIGLLEGIGTSNILKEDRLEIVSSLLMRVAQEGVTGSGAPSMASVLSVLDGCYKAVGSLGYLYLTGNSYGTARSYVKTVREQLWNGKKVISERMESGQEEGESRERGKLVGKRERWPEGRSESQIWPRREIPGEGDSDRERQRSQRRDQSDSNPSVRVLSDDRSDELKEGSDTVLGTILAMERCGTEVIDLIGLLEAIGTSNILKEDRLEIGSSLLMRVAQEGLLLILE